MNSEYLREYLGWLLRNTYTESGLTGRDVDCNTFILMVNNNSFNYEELSDKLLGWTLVSAPLQSDVDIALGASPEDFHNKNVRKFLKAFYEVQSWSDFHYGSLWKEECGIDEESGND